MIIDEETYLSHHGVKGMRWGIRKKYVSVLRTFSRSKTGSSNSASKQAYLKALKNGKNPTKKEQAKNFEDSRSKFFSKFGGDASSEDEKKNKHWRPTGKQIAVAALGAAVVGATIYATTTKSGRGLVKSLLIPKPGEKVSASTFNNLVKSSELSTWSGLGGSRFLRASSFEQPSFNISKGTLFHRISTVAEHSFTGPTYSTASIDDFNRYATAFTHENLFAGATFHHVTFSATKDMRVPDLTTCLNTFSNAYKETNHGLGFRSEKETMKAFTKYCGGRWNDEVSTNFFKKLSEQGYHAIIDYMDDDVIGDTPLVLFNSDVLSPKVSSKMGLEDFKNASENLKELAQRKF